LTQYKIPIHNALLKYGFDNFALEILEYSKKSTNPVTREQYYFELLKPEYNILETAGSSLGFKHSDKTLTFFRDNRKVSEETKKNLSLAATGRVLTEDDKKKISYARTGIKLSYETRAKISAAAKELRGVHVTVTNINTKEVWEFASLTDAAKAIGVSRPAIKKFLDTGKPVKQEYLVVIKK
jgi:group I intron endonuclease